MNIVEFAMLKKTAGKNVDAELFVDTGDVEIFCLIEGKLSTLSDALRERGGSGNIYIQMVHTLPQKLILSDPIVTGYVYVVESTGICYVKLADGFILTIGQSLFEFSNGYDKGWTADINSVKEDGIYCVRKNKVTETPVKSSFDNTGDGVAEVYSFSKALPTRFTSGYAIAIDAVKDITDDNGVHQEAGSHYIKYDEVAAGTGTMPYAHVYCYDNSSANYLRYSFNVAEDGIYELAAHLRIKDGQTRGATYTINKNTEYEHAFVTTYGWDSEEDALSIRNNAHLQGAYMSGMTVYLHKGVNTIHITNAAGVAKNQHFRNLYLVKISDLCDHNIPEYPESLNYLTCIRCNTHFGLGMDYAEAMGVGLAKGAKLPEYYYIEVTFNNGAPRSTDGFCRVNTENGHKMSIQKITLAAGQTMPVDGSTVTLRGKIGCVNSTVNGSIGKEARIFDATII